MSAHENLSRAQFEAYDIPATEVQQGDRLDRMGKSKVHTVHQHNDNVLLGYKTKGAKSGSTKSHGKDETVRVYRKKS